MKIDLKESLNELDIISDNKYDLYNIYLSKNPSIGTKKKLAEAIYKNKSPKEIALILKEDWDDAAWHDTVDQEQVDQPDYFPDDEEEVEWEEMNSKSVRDSDGFLTDYTWYRNNETGQNVFIFGDKDLYRPEDGYFDWECDTDMEGFEWFKNYTGPGDDEDNDWMDESLKEGYRKEEPSDSDIDTLIRTLKKYGFVLDRSYARENPSKNLFGGFHFQVINRKLKAKSEEEWEEIVESDLESVAYAIDDLSNELNIPITWNFGANKEGFITAGIDMRERYIKESLKESKRKAKKFNSLKDAKKFLNSLPKEAEGRMDYFDTEEDGAVKEWWEVNYYLNESLNESSQKFVIRVKGFPFVEFAKKGGTISKKALNYDSGYYADLDDLLTLKMRDFLTFEDERDAYNFKNILTDEFNLDDDDLYVTELFHLGGVILDSLKEDFTENDLVKGKKFVNKNGVEITIVEPTKDGKVQFIVKGKSFSPDCGGGSKKGIFNMLKKNGYSLKESFPTHVYRIDLRSVIQELWKRGDALGEEDFIEVFDPHDVVKLFNGEEACNRVEFTGPDDKNIRVNFKTNGGYVEYQILGEDWKKASSIDEIWDAVLSRVGNSINESVEDTHSDFETGRKYWNKLNLDIDFDSALDEWNKSSELAEPDTWYAKPLYSEEAWNDMVSMFSNKE